MEILHNITTSNSLQSLMTSSPPTPPVTNSTMDAAAGAEVHTSTDTGTPSLPAPTSHLHDNHLLDSLTELTDSSLLDLHNFPHHQHSTKSSIADIILGSGDSCSADPTKHSLSTNSEANHSFNTISPSHVTLPSSTHTSTAPGNISTAPGNVSAATGNISAATGNISAAPGHIAQETGIVVDNLDTAVTGEEVDESPEVNVAINNVVCTFSTRCHLNLRYIALHGCNVELKSAQGMLNMKIRKPSATASIWSSGKVTVTGADSEDSCRIAARRIARSLQKIGFPVKFSSFKIVNVLGTCSLPFGIKLTDFSRENIGKVQYEPELHPGATYRIADISATLKIFSTGSITITAPKVQNIQLAVEHVFPLVYPFRKPKKSDPREIEYIRDLLEDEEPEIISEDSDMELELGEIPTTKSYRYSQPVKHKAKGRVHAPRKHCVARLPNTVINDDDYGSSSSDGCMSSEDSD